MLQRKTPMGIGIRVPTPLKRWKHYVNDLTRKPRKVRTTSHELYAKVNSMQLITLQKVRTLFGSAIIYTFFCGVKNKFLLPQLKSD